MIIRIFIAALLSALAYSANASADEPSLELAIKATYLYKFAPFVQWPETAFSSDSSPLQLCVVGDDPFDGAVERAAAGQRIGAHVIAVLRLKSLRAASGCHIAYIGGPNARAVASTLDGLHDAPVLTVTDLPPDAAAHGVINFVIEANHVRFDIDAGVAARNRLVISSKLMQLARSVKPRKGD